VASRVESVASPEQIVISDTLHQQVAPLNVFKIQHLGKYQLKGKEEVRDLFEVQWNGGEAATRPHAAHTVVLGGPKASLVLPKFKLQHIKRDGSVGQEYALKDGKLAVGSTEADLKFPSDPTLTPRHASFFLDRGQLMVEDVSQGKSVYVRLIGTYTLVDGDVILMGRQIFRFQEKSEALATAAATGTTIVDLNAALQEPVAQFASLTPEGVEDGARFPLGEQEITWGRNKGTYIFPEDGFMSRSHAKVYQRGENFFLEDLGSRNGTFVRVRGKAPVPVGSMVLVGGQLLKVAQ